MWVSPDQSICSSLSLFRREIVAQMGWGVSGCCLGEPWNTADSGVGMVGWPASGNRAWKGHRRGRGSQCPHWRIHSQLLFLPPPQLSHLPISCSTPPPWHEWHKGLPALHVNGGGGGNHHFRIVYWTFLLNPFKLSPFSPVIIELPSDLGVFPSYCQMLFFDPFFLPNS